MGEAPIKKLSGDKSIKGMPAWSTRKCSPMLRNHSVSMVASNRWPGAMCVAQGARYANIYVGYGHKYAPGCFQTFAPPMVAAECPDENAKEQEMSLCHCHPPNQRRAPTNEEV